MITRGIKVFTRYEGVYEQKIIVDNIFNVGNS